jgi:YtoQ family protein
MSQRLWTVYLSGEIHSDWRERIETGCAAAGLNIEFVSPVTIHDDSDDCAVAILGEAPNDFWKDQMGTRLNAVRTRVLIEEADIAIVRFGEKYRQWNAAFDAGYCAALATPYITLHGEDINHALKEVDGAAQAVARTPEDVVKLLDYVMTGHLQR